MSERETGWVIERYLFSELNYWSGKAWLRTGAHPDPESGTWESDPNKALRFARADDATTILARFLNGNGRVAEHVWLAKQQDADDIGQQEPGADR